MAANTEEIDIDEFVQDSEDDDPLYKNGPDDMMLTNIDTGIEGLAGDAGDGLGQAPPLLTVAFDLNGVLIERTRERTRTGAVITVANVPRPGLHHMVRLLDTGRVRLGVFTSATERTAKSAIDRIEHVINSHPSIRSRKTFIRPFDFVLTREHCKPASAAHIAAGGNAWDTVKPLQDNFTDISRVVLVEDDLHKSADGEEGHLLLIPSHPLPQTIDKRDKVVEKLVDHLLALLPRVPATLSHQDAEGAVTAAIKEISQSIMGAYQPEAPAVAEAEPAVTAADAEAPQQPQHQPQEQQQQPHDPAPAPQDEPPRQQDGGEGRADGIDPRLISNMAAEFASIPWRQRAHQGVTSFMSSRCEAPSNAEAKAYADRLLTYVEIAVQWAVYMLQDRQGFTVTEVAEMCRSPVTDKQVSTVIQGGGKDRDLTSHLKKLRMFKLTPNEPVTTVSADDSKVLQSKLTKRYTLADDRKTLEELQQAANATDSKLSPLMPFLHTLAVEQGTSIWDVIAILRHFVPTSDNLLSFGVVSKVLLSCEAAGTMTRPPYFASTHHPLGRFRGMTHPPLQEGVDVALHVLNRLCSSPKDYAQIPDLDPTAPAAFHAQRGAGEPSTSKPAAAAAATKVGVKRGREESGEPEPRKALHMVGGVDLSGLGLFVDVEGDGADVESDDDDRDSFDDDADDMDSDGEEEEDDEEDEGGEDEGADSEDFSDEDDEDGGLGGGGGGDDDDDSDFDDDGEDLDQDDDVIVIEEEELYRAPPQKRQRAHNPIAEGTAPTGTYSQLHFELQAFADRCTPTPSERSRMQALVEQFSAAVKSLWGPQASAHLFGSQATGLALPGSDLDLVVLGSPYRSHEPAKGVSKRQRSGVAAHLKDLLRVLRQRGLVKKAIVIEARVPIIKGEFDLPMGSKDRIHGLPALQVDISLGVENGLQAVELVSSLMACVPAIRPLVLAVKALLKSSGLNETFTGGLSSYSTTNLVVAHLQAEGYRSDLAHITDRLNFGASAGGASPSAKGARHAHMDRVTDLGVLLARFYRRYGQEMNYHSTAVSIRSGGFMPKPSTWKSGAGGSGRSYAPRSQTLSVGIEDPQVKFRDIGSGAYQFNSVRRAFVTAASSLFDCLDMDNGSTAPTASVPLFTMLTRVFPAQSMLAPGSSAGRGGATGGRGAGKKQQNNNRRGGAGRGRKGKEEHVDTLFVTIGDDEWDAANQKKGKKGKKSKAPRLKGNGKTKGKRGKDATHMVHEGGVDKNGGKKKNKKKNKKPRPDKAKMTKEEKKEAKMQRNAAKAAKSQKKAGRVKPRFFAGSKAT